MKRRSFLVAAIATIFAPLSGLGSVSTSNYQIAYDPETVVSIKCWCEKSWIGPLWNVRVDYSDGSHTLHIRTSRLDFVQLVKSIGKPIPQFEILI